MRTELHYIYILVVHESEIISQIMLRNSPVLRGLLQNGVEDAACMKMKRWCLESLDGNSEDSLSHNNTQLTGLICRMTIGVFDFTH